MDYYSVYVAQLYGRGLYSRGTYSCTAEQQASGTCPATTTGGGLTNTGIAVVGFVTVACLIIFVSLIVRIWRRKKSTPKEAVLPQSDDPSVSGR
jgi:hypothetical protein